MPGYRPGARFGTAPVPPTTTATEEVQKRTQAGNCISATKSGTRVFLKLILIHNPKAGLGSRPDARQLLALLGGAGHEVIYQSVQQDHWEQVFREPAELVVVAGGDGAIGRVIRSSTEKRFSVPLTILPLGTANNVSRTLGLAGTPLEELVSGWATARIVPFDVGTATGPWGSRTVIESVGGGFVAATIAKLDQQKPPHTTGRTRKHGPSDAQDVFRKELLDYPATHFQISLDQQDLSGNYILVEAMNTRYVGPNLELAPGADPADGLLDLVLVADKDRAKLLPYLSNVPGSQVQPLESHRGKNVQMVSSTKLHIDDECWPDDKSKSPPARVTVELRMEGARVDILVPESSLP